MESDAGIWVDADACPVVIKEILFRAADRTHTPLALVANQRMRIPDSVYIEFLLVGAGFDIADEEIVKRVKEGDLVVTSDIPLASEAIKKGATALSPRGELHTKENIAGRLAVRDFMTTLRASGEETAGPPPMTTRNRQDFANQLDKWLIAKQRRERNGETRKC
ncbi:MAG: YaiI/YqxD family protein [Victivallales bacterium]|nr:YaiI/YqxD family protein [Victivallales bacterium]